MSSSSGFLGVFVMTDTVMPAFLKFPNEAAIIGRLLAGYGELEIELCQTVAEVRQDFNMAFKAMFRPRGEKQRIDIADAMGREPYAAMRLGTQFSEAIANVRQCLKVRNLYAHCHWSDDFGRCLCFVRLEDTANSNPPVPLLYQIPTIDIDNDLLNEQEEFFFYTRTCLRFLTLEASVREGRVTKNPLTAPKKKPKPILYKL